MREGKDEDEKGGREIDENVVGRERRHDRIKGRRDTYTQTG